MTIILDMKSSLTMWFGVLCSLSSNQIGDEGGKGLGEGLKHNTSLQTLALDCNQIGDEGGKGLGEGLKDNTSLQTLR